MALRIFALFVPLLLICSFVSPARAEGDESSLSFEGDIALLTDNIFRGISRTDGNPALQGTFDLVLDNGLYGGLFVSNFEDPAGHIVEGEFYLGYTTSAGAYDLNFAVSYDTFHGGGDSTGYFEFRSSISRDFGLAYLTAGFAFTPDNREIGGGRSVYGYTAAEFPIPIPSLPPTSIEFKIGHERFEGGFRKWDWSVGTFIDYKGLEWSVQYTDTNRDIKGAGSRVTFGIRGYF